MQHEIGEKRPRIGVVPRRADSRVDLGNTLTDNIDITNNVIIGELGKWYGNRSGNILYSDLGEAGLVISDLTRGMDVHLFDLGPSATAGADISLIDACRGR